MRPAAHALAMRVEDQRGDIGQPVIRHRLGQPTLQTLDREAGGNLADEAPGIGKAGLDRHPATLARVGLIVGFGQQQVEEAAAMFERGFGFEQGRDVDLVGNAEQAREIERGEHCRRLFAFRHQHADRRIGIHMLEDLRHGQKLTHRRRALDRQAGEIGALRFDFGEQFAQGGDRPAAGQVDIGRIAQPRADRIVQLLGVHAEMDPAHAQTVGAHGCRQHPQGHCTIGAGRLGFAFQLVDQWRQRQQLVGMVGRQAVGGRRQRVRVRQVTGEISGRVTRVPTGGAQAVQQSVLGIDLRQRIGIAFQPLRLFRQAEGDRIVPGDVGPPVHVVPDPGGEAERQRADLGPAIGKGIARAGQHLADDAVARILRIGHRRHGAFVFVAQRDVGSLARRAGGRFLAGGDRTGHGIALLGRQQESGMRGEHRMHVRLFPEGPERVEIVAHAGQPVEPHVGLLGGEQLAQPGRAGIERAALELVDQPGKRGDTQFAAFQLARNIQRQLEDGIEQRSFARLAVKDAKALAQAGKRRFYLGVGHRSFLCTAYAPGSMADGRPVKPIGISRAMNTDASLRPASAVAPGARHGAGQRACQSPPLDPHTARCGRSKDWL